MIAEQTGRQAMWNDIKKESNYLRGTLAEIACKIRITGSIPEDDNRLMKFHGSYMQDDRDLRNEREKQKLEPAYQFMVRVRAAGRRRDAGAMACDGRARAEICQRHDPADDAAVVPAARRAEVEHEDRDPGSERGAADARSPLAAT